MPKLTPPGEDNNPPPSPRQSIQAKKLPAQQRATETYERILTVTAETLADVGIERLSTNLICERAGLTPPALYRYFPNKYALLGVLGERLLTRQNDLIGLWITPDMLLGPPENVERALASLILETYRVTHEMVGGMWILKSLRAVPLLEHIRLDSHRRVAQAQAQIISDAFPTVDRTAINEVSRVVVEMAHATVELLFDEAMDATHVSNMMAAMMTSYLGRLQNSAG